MADILAKEAFDALAKFLDSIDVSLGDAPSTVRGVGRARFELFDLLLHAKIPGNVSDQIADAGKGSHGLDGDRFVDRDRIQSGHAHELWQAIDSLSEGVPRRSASIAWASADFIDGQRGLYRGSLQNSDHIVR